MSRSYFGLAVAALSLILFIGGCPVRTCPHLVASDKRKVQQHRPFGVAEATSKQRMASGNHPEGRIKDQIVEIINKKKGIGGLWEDIAIPLKVMMLSGGGPKGAYGAGFLNGLKDTTAASALVFDYDIVTGISTGSIQASFVFLGPDYFHVLERIYTKEEWDKFVPQKSFLSLLFGGNSMRRIDGFEKKLKEYLTDDIIDKVAERGGDGLRRLYVGTVDLDSGLFVRWDMVGIAKSKKYDDYRRVILAACAIPIVFPPVPLERQVGDMIARELHIDGGVRHMAFIKQNMLDIRDATREVKEKVQPAIFLMLNNSLYPTPVCMQDTLIKIATRTAATFLKQNIENDIFHAYMIACLNKMRFRITYIDGGHVDFEDDFYTGMRADMKRLYDNGYEKARSRKWNRKIPGNEGWDEARSLCSGSYDQ